MYYSVYALSIFLEAQCILFVYLSILPHIAWSTDGRDTCFELLIALPHKLICSIRAPEGRKKALRLMLLISSVL